MTNEASPRSENPSGEGPTPRCVFLTGPRGAGMTRWLHRCVRRLAASGTRCAVLLAEEGLNGSEPFAAASERVVVRKLYLPCLCCPALAGLPATAREVSASSRPDWLFIVAPAIVTPALLAEFDVVTHWPRRVVVCLDEAWASARREDRLSPFQFNLLNLADTILAGADLESGAADAPSLFEGGGQTPPHFADSNAPRPSSVPPAPTPSSLSLP